MLKNSLKFFLGIAVGIILILIWTKFIDFEKMMEYMKSVKLSFIILAGILYIFSYFIRSIRWKVLLSPIIKMPISKVFMIWMSGSFINYIIPIRAGEFGKSIYIKRLTKTPIAQTLPSVFIDKFLDSFAIFVVLLMIPFIDIEMPKSISYLLFILITVCILGSLILIFSVISKKITLKILLKLCFFFPKHLKEKINDFLNIFIEGIALFKNNLSLIPISIILTALAVIIDALYFFMVFKAFSQDINFFMVLFGYTLINLSYILPHPPAQIGSNELIMITIFSIGLGLDKEMVSAVMAFAHILTGILLSTIGIGSISFLGIKAFDFSLSNNS